MSEEQQGNLRRLEAREASQILIQLSDLLGTGLDPELVMMCVRLIELGVNPQALAEVIIQIRTEHNESNTSEESEHKRNN